MADSAILVFSSAAVVMSIVIGNWFKVNIGILAAVFAVLIGIIGMNMSATDLFAFIPNRIFFTLFIITAFYGFLVENGTLNKLVDHIVYPFKEKRHLIPVAVFFLTVLIAASGVGAPSATIIVAPLAMSLAARLHIPSLVLGVGVAFGSSIGGNFVFSQGGIVASSIIEESGVYAGQGNKIMTVGFLLSMLFYAAWFFFVFFYRYGRKSRNISSGSWEVQKPVPFTSAQKKSLWLLVIILAAVLLNAYGVNKLGETAFGQIARGFDLSFIFLIGVGIAAMARLADLNIVLKNHIPLNMLVLITGMTVLMRVATEAGMVDYLGHAIMTSNIPRLCVASFIALLAGLMSCFSSAISVVIPVLFPIVPHIAENLALPPALLYSAIFISATCAGIAPFDTGGSLLVSNCKVPEEVDGLQNDLLGLCVLSIVSSVLFFLIASWFWL